MSLLTVDYALPIVKPPLLMIRKERLFGVVVHPNSAEWNKEQVEIVRGKIN